MINETHNPEQDEQKRFFKEVAEKIKNGENRERSLEDPCCLITFILIVLTTFIIGVVVMSTQDRPLSHESTTQTKQYLRAMGNIYKADGGLITSSYFMVILISLAILTGFSYFAKCMVYALAILPFPVLTVLIMLGYMADVLIGSIMVIICIIWLFIFCKSISGREEIIRLVESAENFIHERSFMIASAFWVFIWALLFIVFWSMSFIAIAFSDSITKPITSRENGMLAYFIFVYAFMTIFLTYVRMFMVSTTVYEWYHKKNEDFVCRSISNVTKYHIGSLTFGTFMAFWMNLISFFDIYCRPPSTFSFACPQYHLSCSKRLTPLRGLTTIAMSITGLDFIKSSNLVRYIVSQNAKMSIIIQDISDLTSVGGTIIATGIPALIAILYIRGLNQKKYSYEELSVGFIISLGAVVLSACFINLISDVVQSLFVVSCIDDHFKTCQIYIDAPQIIKLFPIQRVEHVQQPRQMSVESDLPHIQVYSPQERPNTSVSLLKNRLEANQINEEMGVGPRQLYPQQ